MPLPVHVWRVRLASKESDAFQPFSIKAGPRDWVIRLCLGCRREVFEVCPESIPETSMRRTRPYLWAAYGLTSDEGNSLIETSALVKARWKYGGDIGFQTSKVGSSAAVSSMLSRLIEVCLHLTKDAVDA
jgi:hypothetical protein